MSRRDEWAELFEDLRREGLTLARFERQRLEALFTASPDPERAPLASITKAALAKSADEDATVERVVEAWERRCEQRFAGQPLPARAFPVPPSPPPPEPQARRRWPWVVAAVLLLFVAVIVSDRLSSKGPNADVPPQELAELPGDREPGTAPERAASKPDLPPSKDPDGSPEIDALPKDGRGRPLFVEPAETYDSWEIEKIHVGKAPASTSPSRPVPWELLLAALAALTAAWLWARHQRRARPPVRRDAKAGPALARLPPRQIDQRELLPGPEASRLVAGVSSFRDEEPIPRLALSETVAATARAAGWPVLHFQHPSEPRELWLWVDDGVDDRLVLELLDQVEADLSAGRLIVKRASFDGQPRDLNWSERDASGVRRSIPFAADPSSLESWRDRVIVVVVTSGEDLAAGLESARRRPRVEERLCRLASWPRVGFLEAPPRDELRRRRSLSAIADDYEVPCFAADGLVDFIVGASGSTGEAMRASSGPRLARRLWLGALALAPQPFTEAQALELRSALELPLAPWAFHVLRSSLEDFGGHWSMSDEDRARRLRRLSEFEGGQEAALLDGSLLDRALLFWVGLLQAEDARRAESDEVPWEDTPAQLRWRLDLALLQLWRNPSAAARELRSLDGSLLREELREALAQRCAIDHEAEATSIVLPWRFEELAPEVAALLLQMGFAKSLSRRARGRLGLPGQLVFSLGMLSVIFVAGLLLHLVRDRDADADATSKSMTTPPTLHASMIPQRVLDALPVDWEPRESGWTLRVDGRSFPVPPLAPGQDVTAIGRKSNKECVEVFTWGELWHSGVSPRLFLTGLVDKPRRVFVIEDAKNEAGQAIGRALGIRLLDRCSANKVLISSKKGLVAALDYARTFADHPVFVGAARDLDTRGVRIFRATASPKGAIGEPPRFTQLIDDLEHFSPVTWMDLPAWRWAGGDSMTDEQLSIFPDFECISIPAGTFQMGSDEGPNDGKPVRMIETSAYRMMRYELTRRLYRAVMGDDDKAVAEWSGTDDPLRPADSTSWYEATRFANALSELIGGPSAYVFPKAGDEVTPTWPEAAVGFRLPTEAEWERACRAGTRTRYSFGDDAAQLGLHAWFNESGSRAVGLTVKNPWGLHGIHGNLSEWCWDWYGIYLTSKLDPRGIKTGGDRVIRGGSFFVEADWCRSAHRYDGTPGWRVRFLGLRLVLFARGAR